MITLTVKLPGACQLKPSLKVLGYRLVQQGALGLAGVVGFGGLAGGNGSASSVETGTIVIFVVLYSTTLHAPEIGRASCRERVCCKV